MDKDRSRQEAETYEVGTYPGDLELLKRLRACGVAMGVTKLRASVKNKMRAQNGIRHFVRELLSNVQSPDESDVAALVECALSLWNEIVCEALESQADD